MMLRKRYIVMLAILLFLVAIVYYFSSPIRTFYPVFSETIKSFTGSYVSLLKVSSSLLSRLS